MIFRFPDLCTRTFQTPSARPSIQIVKFVVKISSTYRNSTFKTMKTPGPPTSYTLDKWQSVRNSLRVCLFRRLLSRWMRSLTQQGRCCLRPSSQPDYLPVHEATCTFNNSPILLISSTKVLIVTARDYQTQISKTFRANRSALKKPREANNFLTFALY